VHPPCNPEDAVRAAARFHVGLCAERPEVANHWYTVSNKLFDYHMAGLAVVVSGLPSLRDVVQESGAGLMYRPGDPRDLAAKVMEIYRDPLLRQRYGSAGRRFALQSGNAQAEMKRLRAAVREILKRRHPDADWRLSQESEAGEVRPCVGY
jgi:glycosyltransferase involved in cell wall biosynthesis